MQPEDAVGPVVVLGISVFAACDKAMALWVELVGSAQRRDPHTEKDADEGSEGNGQGDPASEFHGVPGERLACVLGGA